MTPICKVSEVPARSGERVEVADAAPLTVLDVDGTVDVVDDTCSHGSASLADGSFEGDEVECPFHGECFCVRTGEPRAFPATEPAKCHPAYLAGDDVCISLDS